LIARFGRRTIYNHGLVVLTILVLLIGILDVVPNYNLNTTWAQSAMMVVSNFFYDLTIGRLCFAIISETSSTKQRGKTIAISTFINALINVAYVVRIPYALNPDQENLRGKLAFVFFGTTVPFLVWCFWALPEMKGARSTSLICCFRERWRLRILERTNPRERETAPWRRLGAVGYRMGSNS
jgi:SP family general alpha glucoside:H+ symporter-like MFS transporter